MNAIALQQPESPQTVAPHPFRRFLGELKARRLKIGAFVFVIMALMATLAWFMAPWYTAQTTLLPPSEGSDMFSNMAGMIESAALNRLGLFSTSTASDLYEEILKSRTLRESLARKFQLSKAYKTKGMERTLKELDRHVKIIVAPSGLIAVRAEANSKQTAADMANFMVSELDRFNRETLNTKAKQTRRFLEERLADIQARMRTAEDELTAYEKRNKVVVATDDAAVKGMGDVMSQKLALQVRRGYMESFSAPNSPAVHELDAEIQAFDREISRLPEIKNEGVRLGLEATIQRKVFGLLTAQYEDARAQEVRDTPTITILDPAQPPEIKTRPKRTVMVLVSGLAAFLIACAWVWFSTRKQASTRPIPAL